MASGGPTVKLTFAGDESDLVRAMDRVGDSSKTMADNIGQSSSRAGDDAKDGLDKIGEASDGAEGKFQGMSDLITGFKDVASGFAEGDVATMAAGFASMAGGITDLVVPAFTFLKTTLLTTVIPAIWSFSAALLANPLTWIVVGIIAVIAIVVLLIVYWDEVKVAIGVAVDWIVDKWNWFKDTAVGIFRNVVGFIKDAFSGAVQWVRDKIDGLVGWFSGLPGRIGGFFKGIGDGIVGAFRWAFNFVADIWNSTVGQLNFSIPSWVPMIGGNSFGVPNMPKFHQGGIVGGAPGTEMMAILQAGERVIPASQAGNTGGAVGIRFVGNTDSAFASAFMEMVRTGKIVIG